MSRWWLNCIGEVSHPPRAGRFNKIALAMVKRKPQNTLHVPLFEVQRYLEQGDSVVAFGRFGGRAKPTGKAFEEDWAMLRVFEGDKVKFYQAYDDTAAVVKAFAK
jgi:ketosteroid isomerase-like protein